MIDSDGHAWLLPARTVLKLELSAGMQVKEGFLDTEAFQAQSPHARSDLQRYLSRTEHSSLQIVDYLSKRGYTDEVAADTIKWACSCGMASDERYAEVFIRSHSGKSPMGNARLGRELRRRGVDGEIVHRLLSERQEDDLEVDLVHLVCKRYGHLQHEKAYRRAHGFLRRRGFDSGLVYRVLKKALDSGDGQIEE